MKKLNSGVVSEGENIKHSYMSVNEMSGNYQYKNIKNSFLKSFIINNKPKIFINKILNLLHKRTCIETENTSIESMNYTCNVFPPKDFQVTHFEVHSNSSL